MAKLEKKQRVEFNFTLDEREVKILHHILTAYEKGVDPEDLENPEVESLRGELLKFTNESTP